MTGKTVSFPAEFDLECAMQALQAADEPHDTTTAYAYLNPFAEVLKSMEEHRLLMAAESLFPRNGHNPQFIRSEPKIGRNSPCTCGSGKKNKKCCNV